MDQTKSILSSDDPPLQSGESLRSTQGEFQLILQHDGNLVLYRMATPQKQEVLWATGVLRSGIYSLAVHRNGNLVLSRDGVPAWTSNSASQVVDATHFLEVQNSRDVVVFRKDEHGVRIPVWSRLQGTISQPGSASNAWTGLGGLLIGLLGNMLEAKIEQELRTLANSNPSCPPESHQTSDPILQRQEAVTSALSDHRHVQSVMPGGRFDQNKW